MVTTGRLAAELPGDTTALPAVSSRRPARVMVPVRQAANWMVSEMPWAASLSA
jgi:hypothetical protein